ncbi:MAG: 30S ribosomal protein S12 methylthiotransferase RimO [Flavobacteriales bacterium]|nr:30S ribosomal protein S12 methylthiotransferase RimO [Flavobacteriales bacterium]
MRTKSRHSNKINIVTLGCSKNIVDSEILLSQLKGNNMDAVHESQKNDSNIIVVNTCGFIETAKQESIDTILTYVDEKQKGNIDKLYVTGCLSHRYKEDLLKEIPQVDAWFGTLELPNLLKTLGADYKHELIGERLTTTPSHYAYLKISEGCNRPCSFCAIPLMRGKHVSKSIEDLVKEASGLARSGVKELLLIAQDLTYYGLDIYGERKLAELLNRLADVEGIEWIRLHYAYPSQFPLDALDVMVARDNICNYLDIPLQHISDPMLKTMRRGITKRRTLELMDTIKQKVPGIAIRTTMLIGHPGESREDFKELVNFVQDYKFDRLGVFTYSHEDNTHSFSLPDEISPEEKEDRADILMSVQQEISLQKNESKVGKTLKVLFDKTEGNYFVGRTEADSPEVDNEVLVEKKDNYVRLGDFANVRITQAGDFDIFGKVVHA